MDKLDDVLCDNILHYLSSISEKNRLTKKIYIEKLVEDYVSIDRSFMDNFIKFKEIILAISLESPEEETVLVIKPITTQIKVEKALAADKAALAKATKEADIKKVAAIKAADEALIKAIKEADIKKAAAAKAKEKVAKAKEKADKAKEEATKAKEEATKAEKKLNDVKKDKDKNALEKAKIDETEAKSIFDKALENAKALEAENIVSAYEFAEATRVADAADAADAAEALKVISATKLKESIIKPVNNTCKPILLKYDNQSCYIDSLFVALFHDKNETITDLFTNKKYINTSLLEERLTISKEILTILSKLITYIQSGNLKPEFCTTIRQKIQEYYKKTNPSGEEDFITKQSDPSELLQVLVSIFEYKDVDVVDKETISIEQDNYTKTNETSSFICDPINIPSNSNEINLKNILPIAIDNTPREETIYKKDENGNNIILKDGTLEIALIINHNRTVTTKYKDAKILYIQIKRNKIKTKDTTIVKPIEVIVMEKKTIYLKSIIIHEGTTEGGHYMTLYVCGDIWYLYNDTSDNPQKKVGNFKEMCENDKSYYLKNCVAFVYF